MGRKIEPTYLGDGVYATEEDRGIVLTTGTHVILEADNVIVLEPEVWAALKRWAEPSKDEEPRGDNTRAVGRTPKEWDEPCKECRGTGVVHKREHFSLWTPAEYMATVGSDLAIEKLDAKHDVPANAVICVPLGDASIFEACKEGVVLARAFGKPVAFEFNGAVAVCSADSDPEDVAKRWWSKAYGRTYEQSMADR